jgi:hypothetical protein
VWGEGSAAVLLKRWRSRSAQGTGEASPEGASQLLDADDALSQDIANELAVAYNSAGHPFKAIALWEKTLPSCVAALEPEHPYTNWVRKNLKLAYEDTGRKPPRDIRALLGD